MAEPMNDSVTGLMAGMRVDAATSGINGIVDGSTTRMDTTDEMADTVSDATADRNELPDAATKGIREHMDVVGSDGTHVGVVDHVEGDTIKLTKSDVDAGGRHHRISMNLVSSVDDVVRLGLPGQLVKEQWQTVVE